MDKANTPEEIVDVVDENDNVIGKSTKMEVNSNSKLIHREISILICTRDRKVLTQQRSKNKKNMPLVWIISVAGHVPSGMSYEEAAHMELKEELGFDTDLVAYDKDTYREKNETQMITSFIGVFTEGSEVKINRDEIEDYKFVNENELNEMLKTEKFEDDSLTDFRKFFNGEFDQIIQTKLPQV